MKPISCHQEMTDTKRLLGLRVPQGGPKHRLGQFPGVAGSEDVHTGHRHLRGPPCPQGDDNGQLLHLAVLTLWEQDRSERAFPVVDLSTDGDTRGRGCGTEL